MNGHVMLEWKPDIIRLPLSLATLANASAFNGRANFLQDMSIATFSGGYSWVDANPASFCGGRYVVSHVWSLTRQFAKYGKWGDQKAEKFSVVPPDPSLVANPKILKRGLKTIYQSRRHGLCLLHWKRRLFDKKIWANRGGAPHYCPSYTLVLRARHICPSLHFSPGDAPHFQESG